MAPSPALMGLPPELRLEIIRFLIAKSQRRASIPCCINYDNDAVGWAHGIDGDIGLLAAASTCTALLQVNQRLRMEVTGEFFGNMTAKFCLSMP